MERLFRRSVRGQVCKPLRREEPVCSQEPLCGKESRRRAASSEQRLPPRPPVR